MAGGMGGRGWKELRGCEDVRRKVKEGSLRYVRVVREVETLKSSSLAWLGNLGMSYLYWKSCGATKGSRMSCASASAWRGSRWYGVKFRSAVRFRLQSWVQRGGHDGSVKPSRLESQQKNDERLDMRRLADWPDPCILSGTAKHQGMLKHHAYLRHRLGFASVVRLLMCNT